MWRAALAVHSLLAAVVLAVSTIAGVAAAFLALLPAAVRRGPIGRRVTPVGRPLPERERRAAPRAEQALPQ